MRCACDNTKDYANCDGPLEDPTAELHGGLVAPPPSPPPPPESCVPEHEAVGWLRERGYNCYGGARSVSLDDGHAWLGVEECMTACYEQRFLARGGCDGFIVGCDRDEGNPISGPGSSHAGTPGAFSCPHAAPAPPTCLRGAVLARHLLRRPLVSHAAQLQAMAVCHALTPPRPPLRPTPHAAPPSPCAHTPRASRGPPDSSPPCRGTCAAHRRQTARSS